MTDNLTHAAADSLHDYRSVASASDEMLDAVRRQDWDALVEAEKRCAGVVARLRAADPGARLDDAQRNHKAQIIRRVLAQDAEIRRLLDPRMHELERLLNAAGNHRRVNGAYRT